LESFDGVLLVDKPCGITSHDVVARVRKKLKIPSVGHAGTLDPMASGLMVLMLGEATKVSDFLLSGNKAYFAKVRLGLETETWDLEGKIIFEEKVSFAHDKITDAAHSLVGQFVWPIPMYSAAKIDGKKLYEMARAGDVPSVQPQKSMAFLSAETVEVSESSWSGKLSCSKGGFIRTWAMELGKKLNTRGTLVELRRLQSDPFHLKDAMALDAILALNVQCVADFGKSYIPMQNLLGALPTKTVDGYDEVLLKNGQISHSLRGRLVVEMKTAIAKNETVVVRILNSDGQMMALLDATPGKGLGIRRVFRVLV
jgi:tRNA pseudouridine55 synthase